jgi:hypothetical protein
MAAAALKINTPENLILNYETLCREETPEGAAEIILEGTYGESDFMKRDTLDRFLDFIYFKAGTGTYQIINPVYPSRRMHDRDLEKKIIEMINMHLYPEIVLRLLKYFTRNIYEPDTNLYIAELIYSKEIVKSVYDTFQLFKKDVFESDRYKRTLNVKMVQQFPPRTEDRLSSPLDAAARLRYILEFFLLKFDLSDIYTRQDIRMSNF